ncbi:MAG: TolC family protein, partial [Bryobacteraceae bacterium]
MRLILFVLLPLTLIHAEIRTLTLKETVAIALKQNPEIALARLDTVKARQSIRAARDPFIPKLYGGSGLAYTSGFPNSIEGSAPSIFTAKAQAMLFNKPQSYRVAAENENFRGSQIQSGVKQDEVVYRAAVLFLDAE